MRKKIQLSLCGALLCAGTALAQGGFHHPGLLHSATDFEAVKTRVAMGDTHALEALEALRTAPPVNGDHGGNWAVNEVIKRGVQGDENYMNAYRNAARAYQCALAWKITGETWYADVAVDVLNAYRVYNKGLGGNTNISLIPGFIGYQFVNAAELMRDYRSDAWGEEEFELFKQYMIDVWFTVAQDFLERRHDTVAKERVWYHYHSNWGLGNALFCVSLGILCDSPDIYNYGMYWIKEGSGNESLCVTDWHPDPCADPMSGYGWGLIPWFHADDRGPLGYLNQMQESGRDQGHAMAALGLLSYALESAYNQGDNAFCNLNNELVPGKAGSAMVAGAAEYVAAYNAGHDDLPYLQNWWMTGLNGTGRGQWRPIWQLFINHYQNKMGIPMKYCSEMKAIVGLERGGGSYGVNSGGYDHTSFGDLMYWDDPVAEDEVPTILFPQIASTTETRKYAEISQVEPGAVLTLSASLPEGEADTGNWRWEDGATGNQRQITADHSGIYRVTYTNANGVESTQMFSVAVRGEGVCATLTATAALRGESFVCGDTTGIQMIPGEQLALSTAYANWNYIESEKWYVDDVEVATGGSYTYLLADGQPHTLTFRLTNQSGVVISRVFHVTTSAVSLTGLLTDPACENLSAWTVDGSGFQTQQGIASYPGFNPLFIERYRDPNQDGMSCWGLGRFDISQTLTGLQPGKYTLGASIIATQQSLAGTDSKDYVKDVFLYAGGANVAVSSQNNLPERFTLDFYVGEDGTAAFGVKNLTDQDYAYSANGMNWFAMDNFTLAYQGLDDLSADVEALRREAADVAEGTVPGPIRSELARLAAGTDTDVATAVALQRALGEARMLQPHYAAYRSAYTYYNMYVAEHGVADAALLSALQAFAEAGSAEACHAAFEALQAAWLDFMPRAEAPLDVTSLLLNAGLAVPTRDGLFYDNLTHWRTDAAGGNLRVWPIDGSDAQRGEAEGANMVERWAGENFFVGERLLFQSLPAVPPGRYLFRATAQKETGAGAIYLFANGDTAAVTGVKELAGVEVGTDVTDGTLSVGLLAGSGNATRWVSMADLALEYRSPLALVGEALADAALLDYGTDAGGMLQSAVSAARQAQASGSPDDCMEAFRLLVAACGQYRIDNASAAHPVDMTARVCNAGFDASNTLGWTLAEVADPAFPKFARGAMEFWHTPFDIRQTLTGLPVGYYLVGLQARSDKGGANSIFRFYARTGADGEISAYPTGVARADGTDTSLHLGQNADDLNADPAVDRTVLRVFVDDGTLTLGAACTGNDVWCVMNGFTLEYVGDGTLALDENDTDYVLAGDAVAEKVTVARKLKADGRWNTFCVPFDMTAEQLDANHVTSLKRLAGAETEGTSVTLRFEDAEEVEAGVPYLLRVSEAVDTLVVEHVTVEAENPENRAIRVDGVTMTGNYAATTVPLDAYFISDNAFYLADYEGVSLKGFRAYITLDGLAQANRLLIDVGGGTTGVDGLQAVEADPLVDVYTMEGRRVKRGVRKSAALDGLPRGVYVVGGEKVAR